MRKKQYGEGHYPFEDNTPKKSTLKGIIVSHISPSSDLYYL